MKKTGVIGHIIPAVRYFYGIAWKHEKPYFLVIIANILITGLSPFVNILLPRYIIDELLGTQRVPVIVKFVTMLVALNLIAALGRTVVRYFTGYYKTRLEHKLDEMVNRKAMTMSFEHTENPAMLAQLQKAKTGVSWYSGGIDTLTASLVSLVAGIITLLGTVYVISMLTPVLFALLIGVLVINGLIQARVEKASAQVMKDTIEINRKFSYYVDFLQNFRYGKDIRMYRADRLLLDRTDKYIKEDWGNQMRWVHKQNLFVVATTVLNGLQLAVMYGYLGLRVLSRVISIGDFQMLISAANSFTGSLSGIIQTVMTMGKNCDLMNEYKTFMQDESITGSGTRVPENAAHTIEFKNVSFKYPTASDYALKNVSIVIPAGQKLSVVGQNGAGKTTFIKLLCRLYDPTEGEILLDGTDIREYGTDEYQKLLAVVFQDYKLLSFSIRENIAIDAEAADSKITSAIDKAGFSERFAGLERGLDTTIYKSFDANGIEFSGGESQKLAIARAIYKDAPITVLDEPTAALDPVAEFDIYSRFDSLIGDKTAIYISHRLSSCRFCDRIAVFKDGEIIQYGAHDELLETADSEYSSMWSAQAKYYV